MPVEESLRLLRKEKLDQADADILASGRETLIGVLGALREKRPRRIVAARSISRRLVLAARRLFVLSERKGSLVPSNDAIRDLAVLPLFGIDFACLASYRTGSFSLTDA